MSYVKGDRVQYTRKYDGKPHTIKGTVAKYIPANGRYKPMVVIEWDDDTRGTLHEASIVPEEK